ncbi:Dps family protein [Lacinutrix iliipiscaria]|uniref:Starvation-inducible DNA-binding protein n=2 Tax=Flavobacteriaceae TaxID=49546 RepID=A0A420DKW6_9FLAO|nr:DNA starvation/stationary phase protection protein [Ichthyenterobacterium magnum]RKE94835.1 starvation-inducible DNA-binding protein [Ichthyenterobacterium magnum]
MKTHIGLTSENANAVAEILSKLLADEYILITKTKKAHWNIEGADFKPMHLFFEEQFGQIDGFIDTVAERIRSIGHYTPGTLAEFLDLTHLTEKFEGKNNSNDYIKALLSDHESIVYSIRENINNINNSYNDEGTSGMLGSLLEEHEKMAWMLRASL